MKKLLAYLMSVCLLVGALTGCDAKNKTPQTVEGAMLAYSGHLLTLKAVTGEELIFDLSPLADQTGAFTASVGDDLIITYTGTLKGADASGASVIAVENRSAAAPDAPTLAPASSAPAPIAGEEHVLDGTLVNATMNTITLSSGGLEYTFPTEGAELSVLDGFAVGNEVFVTYRGTLNGTDTGTVSVVRITDGANNSVQQAASAVVETQIIHIDDTNDNVFPTADVTLRNGPGADYPRLGGVPRGTPLYRTGLAAGGWSLITYNSLQGFVPTQYLSPDDPGRAAPAQPHPDHTYSWVSGVVVDASMAQTTVQTDAGAYTFDTQNAAHYYKNGMRIGMVVTVEYTGQLVGADTSGVTVLSVTESA